MNELPASSAAVGTAIADIFGGPGEDAGLKYLQTLKDINLEHGVIVTEMGKAEQELTLALGRLNTVAAEAFQGVGETWTRLKTGVVDQLAGELEIYADDQLTWFEKIMGGIIPGFAQHNKLVAESNRLQKETNRESIEGLKLKEQDIDSLRAQLDQFIALNVAQKGYFSDTVKAIREEIDLRLVGRQGSQEC